MNSTAMRYGAYLVSTWGVLLHVYLTMYHAAGPVSYHIVPAMNVIPYLLCMILARSSTRPIMFLCASLLVLVTDVYLFWGYMASARTYRFQLVEWFQIMFKTAVVVPLGCLMGYAIAKLLRHEDAK